MIFLEDDASRPLTKRKSGQFHFSGVGERLRTSHDPGVLGPPRCEEEDARCIRRETRPNGGSRACGQTFELDRRSGKHLVYFTKGSVTNSYTGYTSKYTSVHCRAQIGKLPDFLGKAVVERFAPELIDAVKT